MSKWVCQEHRTKYEEPCGSPCIVDGDDEFPPSICPYGWNATDDQTAVDCIVVFKKVEE